MSNAGSLNNTGGGGGGGANSFVTDSGTATPLAGVIDILGGTNVTTQAAGNTILINATGGTSFTWLVVTSVNNPVTLLDKTGYIAKGASPVNFILPAAAAIGFNSRIVGYGNLWTLAQNAGQSVTIGFLTTTAGVTGSVVATMISDGLELVTVTTNLEFYEIDIQGNPTIN